MPGLRDTHNLGRNTQDVDEDFPHVVSGNIRDQRKADIEQGDPEIEGGIDSEVSLQDRFVESLIVEMIDRNILVYDKRIGFQITFEFLGKIIDRLYGLQQVHNVNSTFAIRAALLDSIREYYHGKITQETEDMAALLESMIREDL